MTVRTGKHFPQIPGPTNVPDRVLRAMDMPTIDHRGPEFAQEYSPVLTAVVMPTGHDADHFRDVVLKHFDMSLGAGLSKLKGRVFRIGHLSHFNDLMVMGTLSGVEMALDLAKVPHQKGGVLAAMDVLNGKNAAPVSAATNSATA